MKLKLFYSSVFLLFIFPLITSATGPKPAAYKWVVKQPFDHKEFVENKGQFAIPDKDVSATDIIYGAHNDKLDYYFTKNSIWISYLKITGNSNPAAGIISSDPSKNTYTQEYHEMNFIGANPDVQITSENKVSNYYVYRVSDFNSITASAYKKITYVNLYPGIDMVVYFPENKEGFEYEFNVHPGADVSQIKIQYPLNKGLTINPDGNVVITSAYGNFIDHAPATSQSGNIVSSAFSLKDNVVQFNVGNYDKNKILTIDPWVVNPPTFSGKSYINDAFEVDWDDGGNCYAYGGNWHWTLNKYTSLGTLAWTYQENFLPKSPTGFRGHFAVDRYTQSVYIGEGYDSIGAEMVKLNANGTVTVANTHINVAMEKIWRIAFSRCNPHVGVVGGGNSNFTKTGPYYNAFLLDTTMAANAPVNVLNATTGYHDVCLLTLDNSGNAYMGFSESLLSGTFNNAFIKVPANAGLTPIAWNVGDGYKFVTAGTVLFGLGSNGVSSPTNGINGASYSENNDLFTYDSYHLKKWNSATGALVTSVVVNTNPKGDSSIYYDGITSDVCDHIFIGSKTNIVQYDGNLNQVSSTASPNGDTVFDVRLGNGNILYACGNGFVAAIQEDLGFCIPFSIDTSSVNATCTRKGQANVTQTNGGTSGYRYYWRVLGSPTVFNTTAEADSLVPDFYTVTVKDTSCMIETIIDTFQIKRSALSPTVIVTPNPGKVCIGSSITLTASGATSYTWSPSNTLSIATGTNVSATPTTTTTYVVIGTSPNMCPDSVKVPVTVENLPTLIVSPNPAQLCTGGDVHLSATGAVTYTWSGGPLTQTTGDTTTASPVSTQVYTVSGTDANTCVNDTTFTVTVNPYPVVTVTPDSQGLCSGGAAVSLTSSSNIGPATYTWSPALGLSTTIGSNVMANPATSTTYFASATVNGCKDSVPDTVTVLPLPAVAITQLDSTYCIDAPAVTLNGSGTPSGGTFSGPGVTDGTPDSTFTPSTAGAGGPFAIKYTYTDASGCTNSDSTETKVVNLPIITILPLKPAVCSGNPVALTASGASIYDWSPSTGLVDTIGATVSASPSVQTRYLVIGTDTHGCIDTASTLVSIGILPTVAFTEGPISQCNPLLLQFYNTDTVTGDTYLWNFGDTTTSSLVNPQHQYKDGRLFRVTLTIQNTSGCEDSITNGINVVNLSEEVVFPNAFTPYCTNGCAASDLYFKPVQIQCNNENSSFVFRVYNRWGQMVYESSSPTDPGWDGTFNGKPEPIGVYVYYLQMVCGDCPISRKGNVTLLR